MERYEKICAKIKRLAKVDFSLLSWDFGFVGDATYPETDREGSIMVRLWLIDLPKIFFGDLTHDRLDKAV